MIPISEALEIITRETFPLSAETIDLADSIGRVLAENIFADSFYHVDILARDFCL